MKVSAKLANNNTEDAARIARLCFAKLEAGTAKDDVLRYRDDLYSRCTKRRPDDPDGLDPSKSFLNLDLFGNRVLVPRKVETKDTARPLTELDVSDIEKLTSDNVYALERELGLSCRRSPEERLVRLRKLAQRNTISFVTGGSEETRLSKFMALPESEQRKISCAELKVLEEIGQVKDSETHTVSDRKDRLKEHLWKIKEQQRQKLLDSKPSGSARQLGISAFMGRRKAETSSPAESAEKADDEKKITNEAEMAKEESVVQSKAEADAGNDMPSAMGEKRASEAEADGPGNDTENTTGEEEADGNGIVMESTMAGEKRSCEASVADTAAKKTRTE
jgi:hypothetical protein